MLLQLAESVTANAKIMEKNMASLEARFAALQQKIDQAPKGKR